MLSTDNRLWLHPDNAPKELTLEEQDALGWFAPRPLNQDANAGAWSHASKLSKKHPMWGEDEQVRLPDYRGPLWAPSCIHKARKLLNARPRSR